MDTSRTSTRPAKVGEYAASYPRFVLDCRLQYRPRAVKRPCPATSGGVVREVVAVQATEFARRDASATTETSWASFAGRSRNVASGGNSSPVESQLAPGAGGSHRCTRHCDA